MNISKETYELAAKVIFALGLYSVFPSTLTVLAIAGVFTFLDLSH